MTFIKQISLDLTLLQLIVNSKSNVDYLQVRLPPNHPQVSVSVGGCWCSPPGSWW